MKNCQEWSLAFDQLYNNVTSNKAPGLSEYEKSVFLTDAQDNVVIGLYNGTYGKAFESTEDVSNYLATLVRQVECERFSDEMKKMCSDSVVYGLPSGSPESPTPEILFRTFEWCMVDSACKKDSQGHPVQEQIVVVPITQDEYWRTVRNPFKRQNDNRVLRLTYSLVDNATGSGDLDVEKYSELISSKTINKYFIRYITRPEPIILEDLGEDPEPGETYEGLTIRGEYKAKTCTLDDAIHQLILNEAVRMAKAAWQS